ncbi:MULTISPECIES: CpsD/CapB family tyrosine-protein kinase [Ruminococcus]|jgi:capsular exopolysaccharide synthesis family protein|uniref:non-specific protein-tyrosine kinase n=1 Tax=Ruminococcus difficilis TaxID=2763069 RepID=A0A935C4I4_9FIRM|nr:CpsD/CapB family tyrosine-protein kinase [Ruminococcus difficilis]MBK6090255.1 CpsD/CapB family tyrosine-protein kinase [Ruminococcus difficilis]MBQ1585805.1 CpsD/CapB family tyrosine-protein kinase [Ruminococcus sp.]MBQ2538472.1 CpsD/CapB family tyrosine-protein kinase [Ruminococcus sp.]MBQ5630601.1 CpsD/CapB family tyrosine-protein kinase [Ruminococcus sp.]
MALKIKLKKPDQKKTEKNYNSADAISEKSKFAIVESYKSARSNIMFSLSAEDQKVFAVTSYAKGEGKSTVSANLAISFSKMERRVLLIDCDLRRPNLHNIFKVENTVGLSNIIGKMADFEDAVKHDVLPNLDILPSGTIPPNPSELLCSPGFEKLVKGLIDEYDYIIFDTPPIGVVADALLLKDRVAGYVVVLRERSTTHGDIQKMLESIKLADTKILGFIKVGCTQNKKSAGRGYYYYQYY